MESNQSREIDVRLVRERNVIIYECKGYQPDAVVLQDEIEQWLKEKVPVIYKSHRQQERFDGTALRFEFWTTGTFEPQALTLLRNAQRDIRKYKIGWKDGLAVRDYAQGMKAKGLRKVLNEHYFSHPLAKLGRVPRTEDDPRSRRQGRPSPEANDLEDLDVF